MMRRGEDLSQGGSNRNGWSEEADFSNNGEHSQMMKPKASHQPIPVARRPIPGRPRRRLPPNDSMTPKKRKRKRTFCERFYARWIGGKAEKSSLALLVAIVCWYLLGVLSIGTSKRLLMSPTPKNGLIGDVPPLYLTLQQLFNGSCFFRFLLSMNAFGSSGLQPFPMATSRSKSQKSRTAASSKVKVWTSKSPDLIMTGIFFGLGFLTTNYSFHRSSAAFVETIKAAEPITSAIVAVTWGIETLGMHEIVSLATIVIGVLISTLANGSESSSSSSTISSSLSTFMLVMVTNLCFSFRGLHQKLFRSSPNGAIAVVDDLNFQYRVQEVGVFMLAVPVLILEGPGMLIRTWRLYATHGLIQNGLLMQYIGLSIINGLAFSSYNLASTFILTRISVVHHAALNCIRRIFAIVVTSIIFGIPITLLGSLGIVLSFVGFMCFTHYKVKRHRQPRPLSSLLPMSAV